MFSGSSLSPRRFRLVLERLEDRLPPASHLTTAFDPASKILYVVGTGGDDRAQISPSKDGFLEVRQDGEAWSSDPISPNYHARLDRLSVQNVRAVRYESGGGSDRLALGGEFAASGMILSVEGTVEFRDTAVSGDLFLWADDVLVSGDLRAGTVALAAKQRIHIETSASIQARDAVYAVAEALNNRGSIQADGATGGRIQIAAGDITNAGRIQAEGRHGIGGAIGLGFSRQYLDTTGSHVSVDGATGGWLRLDGAPGGQLFSSGSHSAVGATGIGGHINLFAANVQLAGAKIDSSGQLGGGTILIGGSYQGKDPNVPNAQSTRVSTTTQIHNDAIRQGNGGGVIVWADGNTEFAGLITARGGPEGGDGGFVEVSGKKDLIYHGNALPTAPRGKAGQLLLDPQNIIVDAQAPFPQYILPAPANSGAFGQTVVALPNGAAVVTDPLLDVGGATDVGAVYVFDIISGALLTTMTGTNANDQVGSGGVEVLPSGNFVVLSPKWNGGQGAVTVGSKNLGLTGQVSAANSILGSSPGDQVGSGGIVPLVFPAADKFLILSPQWTNGSGSASQAAGAVTWVDGLTGRSSTGFGAVSTANSLYGNSGTNDRVGSGGAVALPNGNYVVLSPNWANGSNAAGAGAVTFGVGPTGTVGQVGAANSLTGTNGGDLVERGPPPRSGEHHPGAWRRVDNGRRQVDDGAALRRRQREQRKRLHCHAGRQQDDGASELRGRFRGLRDCFQHGPIVGKRHRLQPTAWSKRLPPEPGCAERLDPLPGSWRRKQLPGHSGDGREFHARLRASAKCHGPGFGWGQWRTSVASWVSPDNARLRTCHDRRSD